MLSFVAWTLGHVTGCERSYLAVECLLIFHIVQLSSEFGHSDRIQWLSETGSLSKLSSYDF